MNPQYIYDRIEVKPDTGCWEWKRGLDPDGYGLAYAFGKKVRAHRLSWVTFNIDDPAQLCVLHECDNPKCVNPDHLFLGTHRDNVHDKLRKGRQAKPRITPATIEFIRASPLKQRELASLTGIHRTTINNIIHHRRRYTS